MSVKESVDAKLSINSAFNVYDFTLDTSGDILTENFFDTSILMSIFAEKRALAQEVPPSHLRRGWLGNASTPDFEIGSKLWLFEQSRLTRTAMNGMQSAIEEGLLWLVDDGLALDLTVNVGLSATANAVQVEVILRRPNSKVEKRLFDLWENTGL